MSGVIQVPPPPGRSASAQLRITRSNAVSSRISKRPRRSVFARLRGTRRSAGSSTARGSGECQRIG